MNGNEKFDPAPVDKHADRRDATKSSQRDQDLNDGLEQSFPASDPVSAVQPKKRKHAEAK